MSNPTLASITKTEDNRHNHKSALSADKNVNVIKAPAAVITKKTKATLGIPPKRPKRKPKGFSETHHNSGLAARKARLLAGGEA